ncbi:hypothetical protein C8R47DRAFT_1149068, partial [Mycena vitilis]
TSILVNGLHTSRVYTSDFSPTTVLSASFAALLDQSCTRFALTVNGGPRGSFTAVLPCFISPHLAVDICLGLDWKASVREWLIGLGEKPSRLSRLSARRGSWLCRSCPVGFRGASIFNNNTDAAPRSPLITIPLTPRPFITRTLHQAFLPPILCSHRTVL